MEKLREGNCMGTFFIANNRNQPAFTEATRGLHLRFRLFKEPKSRLQHPWGVQEEEADGTQTHFLLTDNHS